MEGVCRILPSPFTGEKTGSERLSHFLQASQPRRGMSGLVPRPLGLQHPPYMVPRSGRTRGRGGGPHNGAAVSGNWQFFNLSPSSATPGHMPMRTETTSTQKPVHKCSWHHRAQWPERADSCPSTGEQSRRRLSPCHTTVLGYKHTDVPVHPATRCTLKTPC